MRELPETIALGGGRFANRAAVGAWSREMAARFEDADVGAIAALWSLASVVETQGLVMLDLPRAEMPSRAVLEPWLRALAARAKSSEKSAQSWRSARDRVVLDRGQVYRAAERALCDTFLDRTPVTTGPRVAEAFYARASLFGFALIGGVPLAEALRDRAIRLLVGRHIGSERILGGICTVEAMMRGGLEAYVNDVTQRGP